MYNRLRLLVAGILLLFCFSSTPALQETTARISGIVTDAQSGSIAGAEVTLTNTRTGETRTVRTSDDGSFTITFIPPGLYDLSVKATGFKEFVNRGIELLVNDAKTINANLEVGALNETVTVTSEVPVIQSTPTVGDAIENRRVVELPLNDRNFQQLVRLVPGVTSASGSPGIGLTNLSNFSINGTRRNAVNWLVDGVSNSDVGSSVTLLAIPTVDSIQEFRVITSIPTAEFGRSGGGVVNVITRGGGRTFHGGVYEFLRNDQLNANSFFNNAAGRVCDRGDTPTGGRECGDERSPRSLLRYNNFGWNLGGPITLFGYNKSREKSFFFFSQEWRRIIRQPTENIIAVPTLRERKGDFSQGTLPIFDPVTGQEFVNRRIPEGRINSVAQAVLDLYPEPNLASLTAGRDPDRFAVSAPNIQNTRQETVRGDHNFNDYHHLMVRYTRDFSQTRELGGLFLGVTVPDVATTATDVPGYVLAVTLTSTPGSTLVNEASIGFSGNSITTELIGRYTRANVGIPNAEIFGGNESDLPPSVVITGFPTLAANQLFDVSYKNLNPKNSTTWIRGSHVIKFGGEVSFEQKNENAANETQGRFTFNGVQTRRSGVASGVGLADFLLGRASNYAEAERDVTNHLRFGRTEFFIQDTWRIRPNLQLDFGIRYHLFRQPKDRDFILTAFLPELYDPAQAPPFANATGTTLVAGVGDPLNGIARASVNSPFGDRVQKLDKNDWAPRFGFAWSPGNDQRMVIRGGYGIYYDQALVGIVEQNTFTNPPFNNSVSLTGSAAVPILFSNPGAGIAPSTLTPRTLTTTTNPFITPIVQQWTLTVQREVMKKAAVEIGYAGSAGNHLVRPVDINAPTPEEILEAASRVPACNTPTTANTCINLARPFKGFGSILDRQTTATSRYHALISSFKLQSTHGLAAQLSYTYSKNLTDATNDRDSIDLPQVRDNFAIERGVSRLDRTHVFVASYVYELPTPRGVLGGPMLRHVFGGWQIAGITTAQSGLPATRIIQDAFVPRGNRADVVSDPTENIPTGVANGTPYFFNPLAFRPTDIGGVGNAARGLIRFPRQVYTDLELAKNWRWGESKRLQLRVEMFNIFNHTMFDSAGQTLPTGRLPNDPIFRNLDAFLATNSTLGQFTGSLAPREIQIGLKFNF